MLIDQELQQAAKCETFMCSGQAPCRVCPVEKDKKFLYSLETISTGQDFCPECGPEYELEPDTLSGYLLLVCCMCQMEYKRIK